jgi:uncharacterized protein YqeY
MKERLEADIKAALLSGDKEKARALNFIKNSITLVEKDTGKQLSDDEVTSILRKEVKKRIEAAELFEKGGKQESADKEKSEVDLINVYLPAQLSKENISKAVKEVIKDQNIPLEQSSMGRIIGAVKGKLGSSADPSVIAQVVAEAIKGV